LSRLDILKEKPVMYEDIKIPTAQEARKRSGDDVGVREYLETIKGAIERTIKRNQTRLGLIIGESPLVRDDPHPDQLGLRIQAVRLHLLSLGYAWIQSHDDPMQIELEWK
jgi:hypothetical protein